VTGGREWESATGGREWESATGGRGGASRLRAGEGARRDCARKGESEGRERGDTKTLGFLFIHKRLSG
jgi:hypothetical protein